MTAKTVALANTKGGVGKSTTAVHFAEWLRQQGHRVMLVDSDKQGSAASWVVWRLTEVGVEAPEITRLYDKDLFAQVPALKKQYDYIIIDTRGADSGGARAALIVADMAVMPVRDSDFDSAAVDDLRDIVDEIRTVNPALQVRSFLCQIDSRRAFPDSVRQQLLDVGFEPMNAVVHFRAAFSKALRGRTVFELSDKKASEEMLALCMEIKNAF